MVGKENETVVTLWKVLKRFPHNCEGPRDIMRDVIMITSNKAKIKYLHLPNQVLECYRYNNGLSENPNRIQQQ